MTDNKGTKIFNGMLDSGKYLVVFILNLVVLASVISLALVDVYTGEVTIDHMSSQWIFALAVSLSTTAVLTVLIGGTIHAFQNKVDWRILAALGTACAVALYYDTWFDAMSTDIMRFGAIVDINVMGLSAAEIKGHQMFRTLIAILSLIGEPLSASAIVIFPLLKKLLFGASVKNTSQSYSPTPRPVSPTNTYPRPSSSYQNQPLNSPFPASIPKMRPAPVPQRELTYHAVANLNTADQKSAYSQTNFIDPNDKPTSHYDA